MPLNYPRHQEASKMRTFSQLILCSLAAALPLTMAACGSDDDSDKPGGSGGSSNAGSGGTSAGSGGEGGSSAGQGGMGGSGGSSSADFCGDLGMTAAAAELPNEITSDTCLEAGTTYELNDRVAVADGATLYIQPGTTIQGNKSPIGVLVIQRGGKIMADGTEDNPIVFTSKLPAGQRAAGDWGGIILLGKAPNFKGEDTNIEGLPEDPAWQYGGSDANDDSGVMRYVRIEYSGFELSQDNEINGLTMGSVGSGTTLEYIQVSNTLDDGFEWFGGTVNAKWLIVNNAGDDMFDADTGYQGELDTLFGRQVAPLSGDPNGFEMDSDNNANAMPTSMPDVKNVTLCGTGVASGSHGTTRGAVLRENLEGTFDNILVTGFEFGVDLRDDQGSVDSPKSSWTNSLMFGNFGGNIGDAADDDSRESPVIDEDAWFTGQSGNVTDDPGFSVDDCQANPPSITSSASVTGSGSDWWTGSWISWDEN